MSFTERAVSMWSDSLYETLAIVFESCAEWNPDVWALVRNINAGFTIVASAMAILFFCFGMAKNGINLRELRHPETVISTIIRVPIAGLLVSSSMQLMMYVLEIFQGLMSQIGSFGSMTFDIDVPAEIQKAIDDAGLFTDLVQGLIGLLLMLVVVIMSIVLLVIVWGRFLNLYLHCAVSGLFLSAFAGEPTQHIAVSFLKSLCNAAFQGVVIVLALMMYTALISSDHTAAIEAAQNEDNLGAILLFAKDFLVGGFVMLAMCKGADNIASKMGL